jgi:predicted TPR repeat methyltransferase
MSSADSALHNAMAADKAGRLTEAEVGYHRVLRKRPTDPNALHYLGLLHFHRGDTDSALKFVARSLEYEPVNPRAWNALGGMYMAVGRVLEAKEAYRKSTVVASDSAEGWYNLGICLRNEGDANGALESLREAVTRQPDYFRAYDALAMTLYQLGRVRDAAEVYGQWAALDPSNSKARHMAAATSGKNAPSRASDDYVQDLFDNAAGGFDTNLEQLGYRAPQITAEALAHWTKDRPLHTVLDAGCGTGLCGPLIRTLCRSLIGVDLSQKMIDRARARGCYDELIAAELSAFMRSRVDVFDAVVCADTLVYFGPLDEPLTAARETLHESGLLIFTLEALTADDDADHRLEFHGRYAHSHAYVRRILPATGFELETTSRETLRQERFQDVIGYLVVARRR